MDTISGFWAGAQDMFDRLDLDDLATQAGGWADLARMGVADLIALAVPPKLARDWLSTSPRHTLGEAVTRVHPHYPAVLGARQGAPPVLFVQGNTDLLCRTAVSIVGTRRCTPYGASVARHLGAALGRARLVVVSGLARGIDTHVHRGALSTGHTVAVLGHGLSHTSPPSNRGLREEILDRGGAMITAFPDDVRPARWTFPSRNRWIAGLTDRLVVVEAPKGSGALITAGFAADLGVDVRAVPGRLGTPSCVGSNQLIQDGAGVVTSVDDYVASIAQPTLAFGRPPWLDHVLAGGTLTEAARLRGGSAVSLLEELTRMELQGRLVRLPGGRYAAGGGSE